MSDCKHGRLARSCPECALMADLVEACHALALAEESAKMWHKKSGDWMVAYAEQAALREATEKRLTFALLHGGKVPEDCVVILKSAWEALGASQVAHRHRADEAEGVLRRIANGCADTHTPEQHARAYLAGKEADRGR